MFMVNEWSFCVTGTGMYYAGYYAYHPPQRQVDIADSLIKEISAERIGEYLK